MAATRCHHCGRIHQGTAICRPSSTARGYDRQHRQRTAAAIEAEPWCHTPGGCPFPDANTPANPLTGGHPRPLEDYDGDVTSWNEQPIVAQCHRCNSGRLERRESSGPSGPA